MNLQEILKRKAEIAKLLDTKADITDEEIDALEQEVRSLEEKENSIQKREAFKAKMAAGNVEVIANESKSNAPLSEQERKTNARAELKVRGKQYKSKDGSEVNIMKRAATVEDTSDAGVIVPSHHSTTVTRLPFNEVSSVIDIVDYISLPNGNEFTQAFQIASGEGDYTLEATKTGDASADKDGVYHQVGTTFDKVTIKRNKITALDYISEEMEALPDADYAEAVEENIVKSIRKKVAKEIVLGDGTGRHFVGVLCGAGANINANTYNDVNLDIIDENTLSNIVIDYGGSEDVESNMVILMNKLTLKSFISVRGSNKLPVYNVQLNGNTATIDGVKVVFSSNIKPFATAGKGDFYLVYGDFTQYKALDFGGTTAEASKDFKFDQGLIALRGKTYGGGAPAGYKAFSRYRKAPELG